MGFAIIKRADIQGENMGLWLEQEITEKKFDAIVNNIAKHEDHEWGKFYNEDGLLVKGVSFEGKGQMILMKFDCPVTHRRTTSHSIESEL